VEEARAAWHQMRAELDAQEAAVVGPEGRLEVVK